MVGPAPPLEASGHDGAMASGWDGTEMQTLRELSKQSRPDGTPEFKFPLGQSPTSSGRFTKKGETYQVKMTICLVC